MLQTQIHVFTLFRPIPCRKLNWELSVTDLTFGIVQTNLFNQFFYRIALFCYKSRHPAIKVVDVVTKSVSVVAYFRQFLPQPSHLPVIVLQFLVAPTWTKMTFSFVNFSLLCFMTEINHIIHTNRVNDARSCLNFLTSCWDWLRASSESHKFLKQHWNITYFPIACRHTYCCLLSCWWSYDTYLTASLRCFLILSVLAHCILRSCRSVLIWSPLRSSLLVSANKRTTPLCIEKL